MTISHELLLPGHHHLAAHDFHYINWQPMGVALCQANLINSRDNTEET